jgi:enoyl-CoA hydratase/3-hydroxyacyl-CoA dehydrogenase
MPTDEIKRVCFVGGGRMGCFNSLLAACAGYECIVYDNSPAALDSFPERQRKLADMIVWQGVLTAEQVTAGLPNIRTSGDPAEAVRDADLFSESVPERLDLKRETFRQFDSLCPEKTILTTNTSSFLASEIDDVVTRGDRFAALHSHLGATLFDIVGGPRTAPSTIETLERYVRSLGGQAIVHAKERRGYISNTLFGALNSIAVLLVVKERGSPQDVDRAWMSFQEAPSGPFGTMDFVGLDVYADALEEQLRQKPDDINLDRIVAYLRSFVLQGHLGLKTGQGFYTYPDPEFLRSDFLTANPPDPALHTPLVRWLVGAAVMLVATGYATTEQVDFTWTTLTKAPLGPFAMLKSKWRELLWQEFMVRTESEHEESYLQQIRDALHMYL